MSHTLQPEVTCSLCNMPLTLETAKTDDCGKAVHDECYILAIAVKRPESPINRPGASVNARENGET